MVKAFIIDKAPMNRVLEVLDRLLRPGSITLTWNDIKPILTSESDVLVSCGFGCGEDRVNQACNETLAGLAIYETRRQISRIALHIEGPMDMTLQEVNRMLSRFETSIPAAKETKFGVTCTPDSSCEINLTVLAGYESAGKKN